MRILSLRFANLNSLAGGWRIDFTHPSFQYEGLFAITGPTGAGKTTLLDAICLALYGRTPRLARIGKSGNEIMSRHQGECFAELAFATRSGTFRSTWSQRRARKQAGGELQPPQHELVDAASNKIIENKLSLMPKEVERLTGMDFDRFTRSMLLAQGGFAAFLQAAPEERAPILEQITGTGVYSDLSMLAHSRSSEQKKRLEALEAECAGLRPLAAEEETASRRELAALRRRIEAWTEQIEQKKAVVQRIEHQERLHQELCVLTARRRQHQEQQDAFQPQALRLNRGLKALELAATHAALTALREQQRRDQHELARQQQQLPLLEQDAAKAQAMARDAEALCTTQQKEWRQLEEVLTRVREMDLRINKQEQPLRQAQQQVAQLEQQALVARQERRTKKDALDRTRRAMQALDAALKQNEHDAALVEELAGIEASFAIAQDFEAQKNKKGREEAETEQTLMTAGLVLAQRQQQSKLEQEKVQESAAAKKNLEQALRQLMQGGGLDQWRQELEQAQALGQELKALRALAQTLAGKEAELRRSSERRQALRLEQQDLRSRLKEARAAIEESATTLARLEQEYLHGKQVLDLHELRERLKADSPCPLCGSRQHPFVEAQQFPEPAALQSLLEARRQAFSVQQADAAALTLALAKAETELALLRASADKEALEQARLRQRLSASAQLLGFAGCDAAAIDAALSGQQTQAMATSEQLVAIIREAQAKSDELARMGEGLHAMQASLHASENAVQEASFQQRGATQALDTLRREGQALGRQIQQRIQGLQPRLRPFRVAVSDIRDLEGVLTQLRRRRQKVVELRQRRQDAGAQISQLQEALLLLEEALGAQERLLHEQRAHYAAAHTALEELRRLRRESFGDKDPALEAQRAAEQLRKAEAAMAAAQNSSAKHMAAFAAASAAVQRLGADAASRMPELAQAEAQWRQRLAALDFADEAAYAQACLPEAERQALAAAAQRLATEKAVLDQQRIQLEESLASLRQSAAEEQSKQQLQQTIEELQQQSSQGRERIGMLTQSLEENERLRRLLAAKLTQLEARRRECMRWQRLDALIGSADGKKFRHFAQGLTLALMIEHANQQLARMSDRYLLTPDQQRPLELNVIDHYQGGAIRSTKNLSGGESFLVSLALALALSGMASRRASIDSLFLDEGFGSLDEEAMETALETLSQLRVEGRMIGVISHVPAVKERIRTQIQLAPRAGGRSALIGPGCAPLKE